MKQCPYCGKFYPDDAIVCALDNNSLVVCGVTAQFDHKLRFEDRKPRPIRSTTSQAIVICAILTLAMVSVKGLSILIEELRTGHTYSPALFFGDRAMVFKNISPKAYWVDMSFYVFSLLGLFVVIVFAGRDVIIEHKRKVASRKSQGQA